MEKRRPRHSHPEASQVRIRETAVAPEFDGWFAETDSYGFTTVGLFGAGRREARGHRNFLKTKKLNMVPAGGIEPTA
jgi:hypothetical protein